MNRRKQIKNQAQEIWDGSINSHAGITIEDFILMAEWADQNCDKGQCVLCPQCRDEFERGAMELDLCMGCLINSAHKLQAQLALAKSVFNLIAGAPEQSTKKELMNVADSALKKIEAMGKARDEK